LVLFFCNADQACLIITLDTYWDGIPTKTEFTGALCHSAISYPLISGQTNLTVGDWTARRHQDYGKDILLVTIPYERLTNLIKAIPLCTAGKAELEIPEDFKLIFKLSIPLLLQSQMLKIKNRKIMKIFYNILSSILSKSIFKTT
jgi:hypothetical protein